MTRKRRPGLVSSAWIRPEKRHAVYERDGRVCVWCGYAVQDHELTLDHLFPRASRFRDNHPTRLVTACRTCNLSRRSLSVSAWLRQIREAGHDVGAVLRRLRVVRHVPINRAAGRRALLAFRLRANPPLLALPDDFAGAVDGVPF